MAVGTVDDEAALDDWIRRAWPNGTLPPWPRETFQRFYRDHLARQAELTANSALGQELGRLRAENRSLNRRLKAVEDLIGDMSPDGESVLGDVIGIALAETRKAIEKKLEPRLAALEQRPNGLQWKGTWSPEAAYPGSAVVISGGGAWVASEPTQAGEKPGEGGPWRMMMKSDASELKKLIRDELWKRDRGTKDAA